MWLADLFQPVTKQEKLQSLFWMWASLAAVGVVLVLTMAAALAIRRARLKRGANGPRRSKKIPDAWAEAGRRVEPIRMDEPPPDVLPENRS